MKTPTGSSEFEAHHANRSPFQLAATSPTPGLFPGPNRVGLQASAALAGLADINTNVSTQHATTTGRIAANTL
jgi:hypothetical protein